MSTFESIENNKELILSELYSWAETFNPENMIYAKHTIEEEEEVELYKSYEYVLNLVEKLENNQCTEVDYTDILFHIEQINYNETIIEL